MKLKISHTTHYSYGSSVIDSVNELRLSPKTDEHQICHEHTILTEPPVNLFSYEDYFGNQTHFFTLNAPHEELKITMNSIVETNIPDNPPTSSLSFEDEKEILKSESFQNQYAEYLMETPYTVIVPELHEFVANIIAQQTFKSTYLMLKGISEAIYTNFTYDPSATNVHTTLKETLQLKRGVCQDYAHLMIGICRTLNIPARYISGYHFIGDPENEALEVQHASHAWVEAFVPEIGWIPFDPTNNGVIDWRYVKTSHGREYSDVAPVKGVYKGAVAQDLNVAVNVEYIKN